MTLPSEVLVPVEKAEAVLTSMAGKFRNMGLNEATIVASLRQFAVEHCKDGANFPESKLKSIAAEVTSVYADSIKFESFPDERTPITDPDMVDACIRRRLQKYGPLTKAMVRAGVKTDDSLFEELWQMLLDAKLLMPAGRTLRGTEKFQLRGPYMLTQHQLEVIDKIRALERHTALTGFRTTRSVNDIKASLNAEDLAAVCRVLNAK
jgi:hypothetical protein